jgi:hypothetical protein
MSSNKLNKDLLLAAQCQQTSSNDQEKMSSYTDLLAENGKLLELPLLMLVHIVCLVC